jgi:hypothetical protein
MTTGMLDKIEAAAVNAINGCTIAIITLTDIKDIVAIALGVASLISTVIIIRNNTRRGTKEKGPQ